MRECFCDRDDVWLYCSDAEHRAYRKAHRLQQSWQKKNRLEVGDFIKKLEAPINEHLKRRGS